MPTFKQIIFAILFFLVITPLLPAQEIKKGDVYNYARKIVDTMCSESMHGRGYVNEGDSIAANYIKTEFKKFGLKSFAGEDYYQKFEFAVNTFPDTIILEFDIICYGPKNSGDVFHFVGIPGKNFLIDPSTPSVSRDFGGINVFDSTLCSGKKFKKFSKKVHKSGFVLVDDRNVKDKAKLVYFQKAKANEMKAAGVIELVKKLTWDQSQSVSNYVKIQIPLDSIPNLIGYKKIDGVGGIDIKNKFLPNHSSQNIISYIEGSEHPDSFIVFSAHYDHLGQMGKDTYFPGANDNASGCAMLLNLAKYYAMPEHKPKCSIAFMAFCGEEVGLLGSKYYTEHPLFPLKNIKFLLNMDIIGTGEDGITVVNGSLFKKEFDKLKEINTENKFIKDVYIRGKAANSDHYFFAEKGVRACFIYTMGGIKAYHDIYDRAETLPLNEFEDLFKLITKFGEYLQN
jgi:aminopeptidase YwaD